MFNDIISSLPAGEGIFLAIIFILIWSFIETGKFLYAILKKNKAQEDIDKINIKIEEIVKNNRDRMNGIDKKIDEAITEIKLIKANYTSEQRVTADIDTKLRRLEQEIFTGNGNKSLTNRISIIESEIKQLKKDST